MDNTIIIVVVVLTLTTLACPSTGADTWMTDYDQHFTFQCDENQHLKSIDSAHDNAKEDRVFNFTCEDAPAWTLLGGCEWSGFANDYDGFLEYQCPKESVITGIESIHSNPKEDRIFKFKCCEPFGGPPGMFTHGCLYTDFVNDYDETFSFAVPDGMVLRGVSSIHDNSKE
ncbi:hypothetical protein EGW08_012897, partial [Elysia chlorotica]